MREIEILRHGLYYETTTIPLETKSNKAKDEF